MAADRRHCQQCGRVQVTTLVTLKSNVSLFFRRWQSTLSGQFCYSCLTKEFLSYEFATILGTWWGIIGCLVGPYFIVHNAVEYINGSISIARANGRLRSEGRTIEQYAREQEIGVRTLTNYVGIGRSLGEIFVMPDVWRDIKALRGYQVPTSIVGREVAFARIAIIRETIKQRDLGGAAEKMLHGIDMYVSDAFANDASEEVVEYYKQLPLSAPAAIIKSYEGNVFLLAELAFTLSRRLSIVSVPVVEVAALFDEVKAEAEVLVRLSTNSIR